MTDPLHAYDRPLVSATHVERDSRFTIRVDLDGATERVFMADPGALRTVLKPGREVLLAPADGGDRKTDYDAVAVRASEALRASDSRAGNPRDEHPRGDDLHVPVVARLANDLFAAAVERGALPAFADRRVVRREPPLPDGGRADFVLEPADGAGSSTYVEVKSCTHVVDGVARFPDRPTERGRRHLRSLADLVADGGTATDGGTDAAVVFVVQRPDVERFAPYREVDPAFADLLAEVRAAGVGVHALATAFEPPATRLADPELPVDLD